MGDNLDKFPEDEGEFKLHLYTARVRADYSRYQFEIIGSEESKECAKKYNEAAWKTVLDRNLSYVDNHFCGIALNHSVYIHDVLGDPQQAIDFTEDFLKKCKAAKAASENDGHLRSHGIPEIMNLMQENKNYGLTRSTMRRRLTRIIRMKLPPQLKSSIFMCLCVLLNNAYLNFIHSILL